MYPEFIAIYVGLAVLLVFNIVEFILLIVVLKKQNNSFVSRTPQMFSAPQQMAPSQPAQPSSVGNMAFCKKCAAQFAATEKFCPRCGNPR